MKKANTIRQRWMRVFSALTAIMLTFSISAQAHARIIFEDDDFFDVKSQGIMLNANDGGDEDISLQFGNDGTDATINFDDGTGDMTLATPGGDFSFSDDNITTTGNISGADVTASGTLDANGAVTLGDDGDTVIIDSSDWNINATGDMTGIGAVTMNGLLTGTAGATINGAAINLNASSNFVTNIGTGSTDAAVTIGGNSNTVEVDSSNWNVSTAGVGSGFTGFSSTGVVDFSGASRMAMDQASSNPGTCTEGDLHYNTNDNTAYVCTATNTWTGLSTGSQDFESVYGADGDNTITGGSGFATAITGATDLDTTTTFSINSSAGVINIGNDAVAQNINLGTGAAARTITMGNATGATALDFNSGTGGIDIDTTGTASDSLDVNVTGTAGGMDFDTSDGAIAINAAGAANGDVTIGAGDDMLFDAVGLLELNSSAGVINIGNDAVAQNINIGTGGAARTIGIGNATGATALNLLAGSGEIDVTTSGALDLNSAAFTLDASTISLDGSGAINIDSSGGTIGIGITDIDQAINIATNGERTTTIGNVVGASGIALNAGTVGITGSSTGTGDIIFDSDDTMLLDSDGVLELNSSAGAIGIGTDDIDQAINIATNGERTTTIGNIVGASGIALNAGTVGITGSSTGTGDIIFDSDDTMLLDSDGIFEINSSAGVISIGNDNIAQNINIGGAGARTLNFGSTSATSIVMDADGLIDIDSDDGSIVLTASDASNAANDNIVFISGDTVSDAGEDGNDIAFEIEDDLLANITDDMNFTIGGDFIMNATNFDIDASGNLDALGTITAGSSNTTITDAAGNLNQTYNFTNDYVLADNDDVYAALNKLDAIVGAGADNVEVLEFWPEYPDTVIYADGSNNKGTLESKYDNTEKINYYNWTTSEATDQDIDIMFSFPLPADYAGMTNAVLNFRTDTNFTADNSVTLTVSERTGSTAVTQCGTVAAAASSGDVDDQDWDTITLASFVGCTLTAGDTILVTIKLLAEYNDAGPPIAHYADVGQIEFTYTN